MQLQLGLLSEDAQDRVDILPTKSSFIFTTWIKLLSKLLKNLVAWLPPEAIRDLIYLQHLLKGQIHWIVKLESGLIINTIIL